MVRPDYRAHSPKTSRSGIYFAGFTLLELLVVLIIMAIALAAFPLVLDRALPGRRVHTATEDIETSIRRAEIKSIARDQPQSLTVAELSRKLPSSTHLQMTGLGGIPIQQLLVYPDGSTNGARLVIRDESARTTVVVGEITGRMTLDAG